MSEHKFDKIYIDKNVFGVLTPFLDKTSAIADHIVYDINNDKTQHVHLNFITAEEVNARLNQYLKISDFEDSVDGLGDRILDIYGNQLETLAEKTFRLYYAEKQKPNLPPAEFMGGAGWNQTDSNGEAYWMISKTCPAIKYDETAWTGPFQIRSFNAYKTDKLYLPGAQANSEQVTLFSYVTNVDGDAGINNEFQNILPYNYINGEWVNVSDQAILQEREKNLINFLMTKNINSPNVQSGQLITFDSDHSFRLQWGPVEVPSSTWYIQKTYESGSDGSSANWTWPVKIYRPSDGAAGTSTTYFSNESDFVNEVLFYSDFITEDTSVIESDSPDLIPFFRLSMSQLNWDVFETVGDNKALVNFNDWEINGIIKTQSGNIAINANYLQTQTGKITFDLLNFYKNKYAAKEIQSGTELYLITVDPAVSIDSFSDTENCLKNYTVEDTLEKENYISGTKELKNPFFNNINEPASVIITCTKRIDGALSDTSFKLFANLRLANDNDNAQFINMKSCLKGLVQDKSFVFDTTGLNLYNANFKIFSQTYENNQTNPQDPIFSITKGAGGQEAATLSLEGTINATAGHLGGTSGWTIKGAQDTNPAAIYSGNWDSLDGGSGQPSGDNFGIYIGTDGISCGTIGSLNNSIAFKLEGNGENFGDLTLGEMFRYDNSQNTLTLGSIDDSQLKVSGNGIELYPANAIIPIFSLSANKLDIGNGFFEVEPFSKQIKIQNTGLDYDFTEGLLWIASGRLNESPIIGDKEPSETDWYTIYKTLLYFYWEDNTEIDEQPILDVIQKLFFKGFLAKLKRASGRTPESDLNNDEIDDLNDYVSNTGYIDPKTGETFDYRTATIQEIGSNIARIILNIADGSFAVPTINGFRVLSSNNDRYFLGNSVNKNYFRYSLEDATMISRYSVGLVEIIYEKIRNEETSLMKRRIEIVGKEAKEICYLTMDGFIIKDNEEYSLIIDGSGINSLKTTTKLNDNGNLTYQLKEIFSLGPNPMFNKIIVGENSLKNNITIAENKVIFNDSSGTSVDYTVNELIELLQFVEELKELSNNSN